MLSNELKRLAIGQFLILVLVAVRVSGFVVVSPFPGANVPRSQKVGLVLAISWIVASSTPGPRFLLEPNLALIGAAWTELGIGILIGFVLRIMVSAAEVAGEVMSHATGLGSPSLFDPTLGGEQTPLSQGFTFLATLLLLTSGAHRVALAYLMGSFRSLPVGSDAHPEASAIELANLAGHSMAVGLQIALPVLAICLLIQAGLGLVARVAPSLQVFNVGFAILIGAGLFVLASSARDMGSWFLEHMTSLGDNLDRILLHAQGA
jgi:flagellar biosynthetic protein FliR